MKVFIKSNESKDFQILPGFYHLHIPALKQNLEENLDKLQISLF